MRRGRGKGKKQNASSREDHGSGEEEKIPAYRRRGRPQKPMRDDFEEEEEEEDMVDKMEEEEDINDTNESSLTSKNQENERKRKISNGNSMDTKEEENNGLVSKSRTDDSTKSTSTGFRQNGSRRKSKPRRAAEAVVECNGV